MTLSIGFTGTRQGMSPDQWRGVADLIDRLLVRQHDDITIPCVVRHGLCVGGDAEFHEIVRPLPGSHIIGHPGPEWPHGELCARVECDEVMPPQPYPVRNAAIVESSQVMIAAPYELEMQPRGGTWMTVRMALRALRTGKLRELYVVGRDGQLLDHGRWKP